MSGNLIKLIGISFVSIVVNGAAMQKGDPDAKHTRESVNANINTFYALMQIFEENDRKIQENSQRIQVNNERSNVNFNRILNNNTEKNELISTLGYHVSQNNEEEVKVQEIIRSNREKVSDLKERFRIFLNN